jgi:hypothetical protein
VHPVKKSVIVHREVGEHTESFAAALKGAMRHDPDILLVGEMRELETIKLALSCASMGMLVFGTLHTNNAPKTVDRIINAFPADDQNQVRVMLAGCLSGIVAQLLCRRIPKGRCAVHEILLQHEALANTVRSGQIANIRQIIESGGADGMILMDTSLMNRVKDGTIDAKEAYMKAANKAAFAGLLKPGELEARTATRGRGSGAPFPAIPAAADTARNRFHMKCVNTLSIIGNTCAWAKPHAPRESPSPTKCGRGSRRATAPEIRQKPVLPDAGRVGPALPARDPRAQVRREVAPLSRARVGPLREGSWGGRGSRPDPRPAAPPQAPG